MRTPSGEMAFGLPPSIERTYRRNPCSGSSPAIKSRFPSGNQRMRVAVTPPGSRLFGSPAPVGRNVIGCSGPLVSESEIAQRPSGERATP